MTVKDNKSIINFEKTIQELETIVENMEKGELPLEDALKKFEKGIKLTRRCQDALQKAEQSVQLITTSMDTFKSTKFDCEPTSEG